jgi:replicative superfamily II helicase
VRKAALYTVLFLVACMTELMLTVDPLVLPIDPIQALAQEVQATFQARLAPLGIQVKELTGDMQVRACLSAIMCALLY